MKAIFTFFAFALVVSTAGATSQVARVKCLAHNSRWNTFSGIGYSASEAASNARRNCNGARKSLMCRDIANSCVSY